MLSVLGGFAGERCVAAIYARATSGPALRAAWWRAAVHRSACFMVYSCGEQHFWGQPRFIPIFNVFTGLNKHMLKERRHQPCWEPGRAKPCSGMGTFS